MKNRIVKYFIHATITIAVIVLLAILFGLYHGASLRYSENPAMMDWDKDGPYIFKKNDSTISVNFVRGNQNDGFYMDQKNYPMDYPVSTFCYFPPDSSYFHFRIYYNIEIPANSYNDTQKILAISDIESSYKSFRDFLINNGVIDKKLNWTFGKGHLVLLGDFVDRDYSTTQVLWFIYKLEQEAKSKDGTVHFILGNHEIKNLQGNYETATPKYFYVSAILGKNQIELYDKNALLGQWMASKNTVELINGVLFTHGGLHPELGHYKTNLDEVNQLVRKNYYKPFYPNSQKTLEQLLISTHKGVAWYRGYFKDKLTQNNIEAVLNKFNAKSIVVGHTLQTRVNSQYHGRLFGIDVKHPKDYSLSFPKPKSEGLLIENGKYYRLLNNGEKKEL